MIPGKWKKMGQIIDGSALPNIEFESSYATLPVYSPRVTGGDVLFFSVRDQLGRSHGVKVSWSPDHPFELDLQKAEVVLSPGALGCFDDSGAMICNAVERADRVLIYYIGWNLGQTVPFRNSVGIAEEKEGQLHKLFEGPILDRTKSEPHFCASCEVFVDNQDMWRMWYLNCTEWVNEPNQSPQHRYHLKYAESLDGVEWRRDGKVAIDYKSEREVAISRPSVIFDGNSWHMWFSYRNLDTKYQIGYACSDDGINWVREDRYAGLKPSDHGWDSEMVEYPNVFECDGGLFMLYNGNGYGQTGFGIARWEESQK